ncbi:unnamed protein product [Moneuplotes crassus]|uniref:Uncharacterized protein n=1 Tax=Euplotes crassus TaxID=5936 RepID=A0AAD1UKR4_EUPCR|nr:unnamed protein product [Moneuplotes crassus]
MKSTTSVGSPDNMKAKRNFSKFKTSKILSPISLSSSKWLTSKEQEKSCNLEEEQQEHQDLELIPRNYSKFYTRLVEFDEIKTKLRGMAKELRKSMQPKPSAKCKNPCLKARRRQRARNRHELCKIRVRSTWVPEITRYPCKRRRLFSPTRVGSSGSVHNASLTSDPKEFFTVIRRKLNSSMDYNEHTKPNFGVGFIPDFKPVNCCKRKSCSEVSTQFVTTQPSTANSTMANFRTSSLKFSHKNLENARKPLPKLSEPLVLNYKRKMIKPAHRRLKLLSSIYK